MLSATVFSYWLNNKKNGLILILFISVILAFMNLGKQSVDDWDEARNGVNAFEMLQNHDYVNLYYNQQLDTWNNKPPLLIWLIALSYKIFGFNTFALRFPSALATVIFFIFFYKLICLYEKPSFAVLACTILFSTKGIIGPHVGRSGDFDALLICLLMIATYHFLKYKESLKSINICFTALFLGLAFLTKGMASLCLIPGWLFYLFFQKKIKSILFNKKIFIAVLIYLTFVGCWVFCIYEFGITYNPAASEYHSHNALETLFVYDTIHRLTQHGVDTGYNRNWLYFITVVDAKLNLWNYVFYLTMIVLLLKILKVRIDSGVTMLAEKNKLFLFSIVQIFCLGLILTLSVNKNPWYLAPVFPFIVIIISYGAIYFYNSFRVFKIILPTLILFTLARHVIYLNKSSSELSDLFDKNKKTLNNFHKIHIIDFPSQSFFLYLKWNFNEIVPASNISQNKIGESTGLFCINRDHTSRFDFKPLDCFEQSCLAVRR